MKLNAKQRLLTFLTKKTGNKFTTAQAKARFGIKNVSARISELRKEGHSIYTDIKTRRDGSKYAVYQLNGVSKSVRTQAA